jgi:hypothetical protein
LRKQQAEAGDIILLYGDESEACESAWKIDPLKGWNGVQN